MHKCKGKADLKNKTKVETSIRHQKEMNCSVPDGCAMLWQTPCPASSDTRPATVTNFLQGFKAKIGDVYLVFDKYLDYSTKCSTRKSRGPGGYRVFQFHASSRLPPQNQTLNISENKKQLIHIICEDLKSDIGVLGGYSHKLVITGQDEVPVELSPGDSEKSHC